MLKAVHLRGHPQVRRKKLAKDERRLGIRIAYDLIGFIPPSELKKEKTA